MATLALGALGVVYGDIGTSPLYTVKEVFAPHTGVTLAPGAELTITTEGEVQGDERLVSTTYVHLAEDVKPGDRLLIDDGLLEQADFLTEREHHCTTWPSMTPAICSTSSG